MRAAVAARFVSPRSPRFPRDGWCALARDIGSGFVLVFVDTDQATALPRQAAANIQHPPAHPLLMYLRADPQRFGA